MAQTLSGQLTALLGNIQRGGMNMYSAFSKLSTIINWMNDQDRKMVYEQQWTNPDAAAAIITEYELNTKDQTDCPIAIAGEAVADYPRNWVITGDTLTGATVVSGTITGKDQFGDEQVEAWSVTTAAKVWTGSVAWSGIPVMVITLITGTGGANDSITGATGYKMGLNCDVLNESDAIIKLNMDGDDSGIADSTVDGTNNTIIFETAPNAAHEYSIWYRAGRTTNIFDV